MERSEKQRLLMEWAKTLASKYDIFPETVLDIFRGFLGTKRYRLDDGHPKYMTHKERTEEFLELYFQGLKGE